MKNGDCRFESRKPCNSITLISFLLILSSLNVPFMAASKTNLLNVLQDKEAEDGSKQKSVDSKALKKEAEKNSISGSVGAGLSMTSGNSNTMNWNMSFDLKKNTASGHMLNANGLYLRGKESGKLSVDRLRVSLRDDYSINNSIVSFGNISYKKDPLKGINYLINPMGGLGWKILDSEKFSLQADAGAGIVMEQDSGMASKTSVSINSNQSFAYKLSDTASFKQRLDVLWKAEDLEDYLVNVSLSLATKVTDSSELQAEFLNDFKNKPSDITYKKNDIALILKFIVRF